MKVSNPQLYPLKFNPILKEKIWGGSKLNSILNKNSKQNIGESWELSGVDNDKSVISNGILAGKSIDWLLSEYNERLVGDRVYQQFGNTFPLLFKFIDAAQDLSVQVHPGDGLAKQRHSSFGKTEMWYILQIDEDAKLIVGFKNDCDQKYYERALSENKILETLNVIPVQKGDAVIINPGTVHAIGAGVLLAEIQQTSDITYRIYDWNRPGTDGKMRELHTEMAVDAINFYATPEIIKYSEDKNTPIQIGETQFFAVNKLNLSQSFVRCLKNTTSFTVYMCLEGSAIIEGDNFVSETITKGETVLIPAEFNQIKFNTKAASFLEVYIP